MPGLFIMTHTNRLISESSPYLLQHAHNPVDWHPWSDEALQKASSEDKPILVSIGYAACHWCHVMERESFEDVTTAALMNKYFVCIKIDREERPDLDHFFMDALQATSGNGGWPLNMFLTSKARPFYGGTYFPPRQVHNRLSWMEVLEKVQDAYVNRREEIEQQASHLIQHLQSANPMTKYPINEHLLEIKSSYLEEQASKIVDQLMAMADHTEGGFGRAPKFPQTFSIQYLLRYHHYYDNQLALDQAMLSLKKMIRGGIYDQVGGGFCRYSTDAEWLAPHFEKMTYDNALLLGVISEAFQISSDEEFKIVAVETINFMKREMLSSEGGFYSALDADSEGVEGKFYTWTKKEFEAVLGEASNKLADFFDVTEHGNWEHVNILRVMESLADWGVRHGMTTTEAMAFVAKAKEALLEARSKRIRPSTDDKLLLGWNALFNTALSRCSVVFNEPDWLSLAERNMEFLIAAFHDNQTNHWMHTHKHGVSKHAAFLDDLAFLIQALIHLYEPTGNLAYLERAKEIMEYVITFYSDEEGVFFYFTPAFQQDILVRKKEIYDGAIPSSNGTMAWNLLRLGILFDFDHWKERSKRMLDSVEAAAIKYPSSFGVWSNLFLEFTQGTYEIVILGKDFKSATRSLLRRYLPNKVLMAADKSSEQYPLLSGKLPVSNEMRYFACIGQTCKHPLSNEDELFMQILTNK